MSQFSVRLVVFREGRKVSATSIRAASKVHAEQLARSLERRDNEGQEQVRATAVFTCYTAAGNVTIPVDDVEFVISELQQAVRQW